jgi:hypothetical protein
VALDFPDPAPKLELEWLLGAWYVLFSNRAELRGRTHARVEHDMLEPESSGLARLQVTLRFRSPDLLGREKARLLVWSATAEPSAPAGRFVVHGQGLARVSSSRSCFPIIEPEQRWAVAWHGRSSLGGAAGLDIYSRDPSISQARLDAILAALRAHPFLRDHEGSLFATVQDWFPPEPYRLG